MIAVFGAGGVAREVAWMLAGSGIALDAFVTTDDLWTDGAMIDGISVLQQSAFLHERGDTPFWCYVAIGDPSARARVVRILQGHARTEFPCLVAESVPMDSRPSKVRFGHGVIVYPGATLTTEITLGDFVHVNPGATIAHHAEVGAFSTVCPGAVIAGGAVIGDRCFIGAGAILRDGVRIADDCLIGAGAVVVSDLDRPGTWIGCPARLLAT